MIVSEQATFGSLDLESTIKGLYRQALRYHLASTQDSNFWVASRHNGYAVALVDALHGVMTEEEFRARTGRSLRDFRNEVLAMQDKIDGRALEIQEVMKKRGIKVPGL